MDVWVERELAGCEFPDQRLEARLGKILTALGRKIGSTLPTACQDWAATKAAYRFFGNPRIDESIILAGHFAATRARLAATHGPFLVLHDTTELSFRRERPETIGKTRHAELSTGPHPDHKMRATDAFQSGDHDGGQAAGALGRNR